MIKWHSIAFKWYWKKISTPKRGRHTINWDLIKLIRSMARENLWRAPRIHGEILKLGFDVSERTISRYIRNINKNHKSQSWITFIKNHLSETTAMDFIVVPTLAFRLLYVFFIIDHKHRKIIYTNCTYHPSSEWVSNQLKQAFPYDKTSKYMVLDNDSIFNERVTGTLESLGIEPKRISYKSPWQNGIAERWVKTYREEFLNHMIIKNENHLRQITKKFVHYYNNDRTHIFNSKDSPNSRPIEKSKHSINKKPILNGLHHRYFRKN